MELDPRKTILTVCKPGEYSGREAHLKLNAIADSLHKSVMKACSLYASIGLLEVFYDLFDKACYVLIDGTHWFDEEYEKFSVLEMSPSALRYLLETALCSSGNLEGAKPNQNELRMFGASAYTFLDACNFSNYLFYSDYMGGFKVSSEGDVNLIIDEKVGRITEEFLTQMRSRKAQVMELGRTTRTEPDDFFKSQAAKYNSRFERKYGVSLSAIVDTVLSAFKMHKNPPGTLKISRRYLVKQLVKSTKFTKRDLSNAIRFFEISKESLSGNWQYFRFYNVPLSVSRRPVLNLSGKVGHEGTLLFGPSALLRAMSLLFSDIEKGYIELDLNPESLSEKRGHDFEKETRKQLQEHGFTVSRIKDTPAAVGEIDAVAVDKKQKVLLVVEAKSPRIELSMSKVKWQIERSRKWYEQLKPKVQWVSQNLELVKHRLGVDERAALNVEGIIIVEVPWYFEQSPQFKVVTSDELELFLLRKTA